MFVYSQLKRALIKLSGTDPYCRKQISILYCINVLWNVINFMQKLWNVSLEQDPVLRLNDGIEICSTRAGSFTPIELSFEVSTRLIHGNTNY